MLNHHLWKRHSFKLMRLGSPNRIDDDSDSKAVDFDRRLMLIRLNRWNPKWRLQFQFKLDLFSIKIVHFWYKFDLLIDLNRSNVDYLIKNGRFILKIVRSKIGRIWSKMIYIENDNKNWQFGSNSTNFDPIWLFLVRNRSISRYK